MDTQKIDAFMMNNAKYFESYHLPQIRNRLETLEDGDWSRIYGLQFKDPMMMLIASLLGGSLGIDRFLIGDVGMGVGKLLTCGGFGIWTIIDWFLIMGATREKNVMALHNALP